MNERQYALTVGEDVTDTLTCMDCKGAQCVFETKTLKIRCGCKGGGKGALIQDNKSATLSTSNDQTVFVPKVYGICSKDSNSMKSANPHSGIYEAETSRTLDKNGGNPACNQGGIAVVEPVVFTQNQLQTYILQGSMIGREEKNGPQGDGINEDVCFTLNTVDRHATVYSMTTGCFPSVHEEKASTLMARDYKDTQMVNQSHYVIRRLTPTECALLQGFPPDWCAGLGTIEPTDGDIAFWSEVWETHRLTMGTSTKSKSYNQIVKWLKDPCSDAAAYKMWGNGVALPCVVFVLGGIVSYTQG